MSKIHGHTTHSTQTPTYKTWAMMLQRCKNPNHRPFPRYGGRGINVCQSWLKFENFLKDMGERPKGLTLGRIDNDGNYEPGNCEWQTKLEQQQNTCFNHNFTVNGVSGCIGKLARHFGISLDVAYTRVKRGWSPERAFLSPVQVKSHRVNKS